MFAEIANESPRLLAVGARAHAMIATAASDATVECLKRDDWTCHRCGIRLPGFMEIDHVESHDDSNPENLKAICQFCHNLRHPVWAALRGRLKIIWAPGLKQASIHRLAWHVLLASGFAGDEFTRAGLERAALSIADGIGRRECAASQILGSSHPEAFFEALLAAKSMLCETRFAELAMLLDASLRFWPAAVDRISEGCDRPSASVSCWREGGFADVAEDLQKRYWDSEFPGHALADLLRSEEFGD